MHAQHNLNGARARCHVTDSVGVGVARSSCYQLAASGDHKQPRLESESGLLKAPALALLVPAGVTVLRTTGSLQPEDSDLRSPHSVACYHSFVRRGPPMRRALAPPRLRVARLRLALALYGIMMSA